MNFQHRLKAHINWLFLTCAFQPRIGIVKKCLTVSSSSSVYDFSFAASSISHHVHRPWSETPCSLSFVTLSNFRQWKTTKQCSTIPPASQGTDKLSLLPPSVAKSSTKRTLAFSLNAYSRILAKTFRLFPNI